MLSWDKPNSSQYCSWIAELEQYDFEIVHRAGVKHGNADGLSRGQCGQCEIEHEEPLRKRNYKTSEENIRSLNSTDEPDEQTKKSIIESYHNNLGHLGFEKTLEIIRRDYQWAHISADVRKIVLACQACASRKQGGRTKQREKFSISASKPFEKIMIDIAGPLAPASRYGHVYILCIVDVFSRFPMIIPLKNIMSKTIVKNILHKWISIFGCPEKIISDNAPNFTSELMKEFCMLFGIKKSQSTPYYPQGNGIVERYFRTIKDMLFATCKQLDKDWVDAVPHVEMGLRMAINNSTGYSPSHIIFGNFLPTPQRSLENNLDCSNKPIITHNEYIDRIKKVKLYITQEILKSYPDKSRKNIPNLYKKGDIVMIKNEEQRGFMVPRFLGPCHIKEILSPKTYRVQYNNKIFIKNEKQMKIFNGKLERNSKSRSIETSILSKQHFITEQPIRSENPRRTTRNLVTVQRYGYQ